MSTITPILPDQTSNMGGIQQLWITALADFVYLPNPINERIDEAVIFKPNCNFEELEIREDSAQISIKTENTEHGEIYEIVITGFISKITEAKTTALKKLEGQKLIVLVLDYNNQYRIAGSNIQQLLYSSSESSETSKAQANGYKIKLEVKRSQFKPAFYPFGYTDTPLTLAAPEALIVAAPANSIGKLQLSWTDSGQGDLVEIWREKIGQGIAQKVHEIAPGVGAWLDTNLDDGQLYEYKVRTIFDNGNSDYSETVQASTTIPVLVLKINQVGEVSMSTSKSGIAATWKIGDTIYSEQNEITHNIQGVTTCYLYAFDGQQTITSIIANDCGAFGTVDTSHFTKVNHLELKNADFDILFGTWVQQDNLIVDITNSTITRDRMEQTTNNLILANGGDPTAQDENGNYTNAGENHLNRSLAIGTLTIDITVITSKDLYNKITALEDVGWSVSTIDTICNKQMNFIFGETFSAEDFLDEAVGIITDEMSADAILKIDWELSFLENDNSQTIKATDLGAIETYIQTTEFTDYFAAKKAANDYDNAKQYKIKATVKPAYQSEVSEVAFMYKSFPFLGRACGVEIDVRDIEAVAAYSFNNIQSNYSGAFVLLKRLSDGQEQEFSSDDNLSDISIWAGNSNPIVLKFFDQSGSQFDLVPFQTDVHFNLQNGNLIFVSGSLTSLLNFQNTPSFSIVIKGMVKILGHQQNLLDYDHGRSFPSCAAFVIQGNYFATSIGGRFGDYPNFGGAGPIFPISNKMTTSAVIFDNQSRSMKLYTDGILVYDNVFPDNLFYDNRLLTVGGFGQGGRFWNGELNALIFYKKAISEQELSRINDILQ